MFHLRDPIIYFPFLDHIYIYIEEQKVYTYLYIYYIYFILYILFFIYYVYAKYIIYIYIYYIYIYSGYLLAVREDIEHYFPNQLLSPSCVYTFLRN